MKKSDPNTNTISQEWIEKIAERIKPGITEKIYIELLENSSRSLIDLRVDPKEKSNIYIGILNNSEGAIIGSLAHELAHHMQPQPTLPDKFYYKAAFKLTGSRRITNKISHYVRFFSLSTFIHESRTDKLGMELLRNAQMDTGYIKEMLKYLLRFGKSDFTVRITARMRLIKFILEEKLLVKS